ncbi:unknown [Alistipes sp. CAG:29]|nr:unknown [Alistipes sp. CAG:29]
MGEIVVPHVARREPDLLRGCLVRAFARRSDRGGEQDIPEKELLFVFIRAFVAAVVDIHRPVERHHRRVGLPYAAVNIGHQLRAHVVHAAHGGRFALAADPRTAVEPRVLGRMYAQGGRKGAELRPAHRQLGVRIAAEPADIMRPVVAARVAAGSRELNLESQHFPVGLRVARELDRMAMVTPTRPTAVTGAAQPLALGLAVVELVDPLQRRGAVAAHLGIEVVLLPVEPPEIGAHILGGMVRMFEKRLHVFPVAEVEKQRMGGVGPHVRHKGGVHLLVGAYAVVGMVVERHRNAAAVHLGDQRPGIGNAFALPRIARPAAAAGMPGADPGIVGMPAHVEDEVVEREIVLLVAVDDRKELLRRIVPVTAVPDAVDVFAGHGNAAADGAQVGKGGLVVVAVDETVLILHMAFRIARAKPAVDQQVGAFVVDHIPAVAAQQAVLHGDLPGNAVERLDRAAEVVAENTAVGELLLLAVELVVCRKVMQPERESVVLVDDAQGRGGDLVAVPAQLPHPELRRGEQAAPVVSEIGGVVDEFAVVCEFESEQRRGDERQAVLAENERVARRLCDGGKPAAQEEQKNQKRIFHDRDMVEKFSAPSERAVRRNVFAKNGSIRCGCSRYIRSRRGRKPSP